MQALALLSLSGSSDSQPACRDVRSLRKGKVVALSSAVLTPVEANVAPLLPALDFKQLHIVRLYDSVRLYGNLFQPSFKLREKTRIGARVIKRYHPPVPPAARVLAHPGVADSDRERLRLMMEAADPVTLFAGIRAAQEDLGKRVDRRGLNGGIIEPATIDLQRFVGNLKTAWRAGETRPTHRRPYRRTKPFPKRPSKYEPYQDEIRNWLEADPALSAAAVLQWLMAAEPTRFTPKSLRMTQRLVKMWRAEIAARIIVDGGWTMTMSAAHVEARSDCTGNVTASALGNILR